VWLPPTPPTTSATTGNRARCWCRRRPLRAAIFNGRTQVPLARGKVRHVGKPVAVVVAESRYIAEDALADITVEYQLLPAVTDLERALAVRFGASP
jgi:CO/xanthine dehydrogenase Mo-binding subunit